MNDVIEVAQVGKVLPNNKIRLGEMKIEIIEGQPTTTFKFGKVVKLGDGLELASTGPNTLNLLVTAAAAKRLGWPHPANTPALTRADLGKLLGRINNQNYGEEEQKQARVDLEKLLPELTGVEADDVRYAISAFDRSPFRSAA